MNIKQDTGRVLGLALPSMAAMTGNTMVQLVDTMFIGRINPLALAAAGLTGTLIWNIQIIAEGLAAGMTASISRSIGEKRNDRASEYLSSGLIISLILSFCLLPLIIGGTEFLFSLIRMPRDIFATGSAYFKTFMMFLPSFFGLTALQAAFNASGETRTTMKVSLFMNAVNIILDRLLIFGFAGWAGMGIRGAALASGISFTSGFILLLVLSAHRDWSPFRSPKLLSAFHIRIILKVGIPTLLEKLALSTSQMFVMVLAVVPLGSMALGTFHIVMRLASLSFMPGFGFSIASATLCGQSLGAKQPERAHELVNLTTLYAALIMTALSLTYFLTPRMLLSLFTDNPQILTMGKNGIRIYACFAVFLAPTMVFNGALQGAGDTKYTFMTMLLSRYLLRLPLSWFLGIFLKGGVAGVWLAMSMDFVFRGFVLFLRFKNGKWEKIELK